MKWESDPRTQNALHRLRDYGDLRSKSKGPDSRIARARDGAAHNGNLRRRYSASVAIPLSYSFSAVGAFRLHACGISSAPLGGTFYNARRHFDLYMPGISPSVGLTMNQVLLK